MYQTFETDRLILRPTNIDDAPFIYELLNTPKWLQYIGDRQITSVEVAQKYIEEKMLPQLKEFGYSNYTIIRKIDQQKIGSCGLYNRDGLDGIDLGFAFLPAYEKMGFAFEAANILKEAAFIHFKLKTLLAITSKENTSSQKLLEKLGLKYSGTTTLPNDSEELLLYKIENK
ncbi:GNAT family N-acetyltransferase [Joostella sp. CR20]|uniref:GNAT family N-acetyltransferase n=1 Tax=Joostella sp. CR20 TaxID=2804312 RepID=UPI00313CDD7D